MTKVEICNAAIFDIGGAVINSLEYPYESKEAEVCDASFDSTVLELLSDFNWSFALTSASLVLTDIPEKLGFEYAYLLPGDLLKLVEIFNENSNRIAYKIIKHPTSTTQVMLTNKESVSISYITNILSNVENFNPLFTRTVSTLLAVKLIPHVYGAENQALVQRLRQTQMQLHQEALLTAQAHDANQQESNTGRFNWYVESRGGYYGN